MWPEVSNAKSSNRKELLLSGEQISKKINESGLDENIFLLDINFLNINETCLTKIPDNIKKLTNLTTLVLHSNKIEELNENVSELGKLKVLDLSRNNLKSLPENLAKLSQIVTLNFSNNVLESFPPLANNSKLSVLDLSNNKLSTFPDICNEELTNLSELKLNNNVIEEIPNSIHKLPALKLFDISNNSIKTVPGEIADCHKLKEINLQSNPISDKRLLKLIQQCRTKQIIDYIKQHVPKSKTTDSSAARKGSKNKKQQKNGCSEEGDTESKYNITIKRPIQEEFRVVIDNSVKEVREHIVCCLVNQIKFDEDNFKKFIQLQNRLHDGLCEKRNAATIATHDFEKLPPGNLTYKTTLPEELIITPLNRSKPVTGADLFSQLQTEATNLRKEKKRNTYSGIHKYLYLIETRSIYPCLVNSKNEVISFPPITNSDISKIGITTSKVFIEVTSSQSLAICKNVMNELIREMADLFENFEIEQVRCTDDEGHLKVVFPSKNDLNFLKAS